MTELKMPAESFHVGLRAASREAVVQWINDNLKLNGIDPETVDDFLTIECPRCERKYSYSSDSLPDQNADCECGVHLIAYGETGTS